MAGKIKHGRKCWARNEILGCSSGARVDNVRPSPYYLRPKKHVTYYKVRNQTKRCQTEECSSNQRIVPYNFRKRKYVDYSLSSRKKSKGGDQHDKASAFYLYKLPDELLMKIFSYNTEEDICRLAQVCRRFHAICNDKILWKDLYRRVFLYEKPLIISSGEFQFVDPLNIGKLYNPWKESFVQLYQGIHVRSRYEDRYNFGPNNRSKKKMKFFRKIALALKHSGGIGRKGKKFIFVHAAKSNAVNIRTIFHNVILLFDDVRQWPQYNLPPNPLSEVRNTPLYYFIYFL